MKLDYATLHTSEREDITEEKAHTLLKCACEPSRAAAATNAMMALSTRQP